MNILNDMLDSLNMDSPVGTGVLAAHWKVVCSRFCGMTTKKHIP
jgi:hypothetical protein